MNKNQIEIERKFVILKPDLALLSVLDGYSDSEITQTYLSSSRGITHRVRKRVKNGEAVYTETKKIRIDGMSAIEQERELTAEEYASLLSLIAEGTRPILKRRVTFIYSDKLFEIDIYPEWGQCAILEIELDTREECFAFPDFIRVVAEVTGDFSYSNASMSRAFPKEPEQ